MFRIIFLIFGIYSSLLSNSFAQETVPEEEGFFSKAYHQQLRPIVEQSLDETGKSILKGFEMNL